MVVKWNKGENFEELDYTAGSFPNGIALDQENGHLIVNYNLGDQTILFDLDLGEVWAFALFLFQWWRTSH